MFYSGKYTQIITRLVPELITLCYNARFVTTPVKKDYMCFFNYFLLIFLKTDLNKDVVLQVQRWVHLLLKSFCVCITCTITEYLKITLLLINQGACLQVWLLNTR